ncbi:MAG TPA: ATP-binding protein [Kofleriaceae bacterium]|jgi:signal transduction histidine kinase|nr:ATP-binding protein [Kofleriaceae bacterium]
MKLRGRFTLSFALAALVPIAVAAVATRQVIASSYRADYEARRQSAEARVEAEIKRLREQVQAADKTLASHTHPFVGGLLLDLAKQTGPRLDYGVEQKLRDQSGPLMRGLSLDVLTITDKADRVLCSPHAPGKIGESNHPEVRERATGAAAKAGAFFVREDITKGLVSETALVVEASGIAQDGVYAVAVAVGRRVKDDILSAVRTDPRADARIVAAGGATSGEVLVPPVAKDWAQVSQDPPIRVPLLGPDGTPVAAIEVAVSDGDLARVLQKLTVTSAALALGALIGVVMIGLLVARRTARDLDQLVAGSLAAARGDLDHRVPVRSDDEIGAVAAAFNFMMEDLRTSKDRLVIAERIAAWQEIARRLAHEIKNPLTPIQMAMDTLRKTWKKQHPSFGEILEESTATVMEEADRLKHIVSEFSAFARMPKPEFQRLDLNELVRSALVLYQGGAAPIEVKLFPALPRIDADKNQLNQVVLNLVENARDAIGQRTDGHITVETRIGEAGDRAMLVVEDNGPGIPSELKDKVFAPYFTTKHAKGGTGLGLAIVHRIVSDHGGRIAVADAPGGGARFAIELPLRNGTALLTSRI